MTLFSNSFLGEATYTTFNFAACHHVPMSTLNALDVVMRESWQSMSNMRRTCKDGNSRQKVSKARIGIYINKVQLHIYMYI